MEAGGSGSYQWHPAVHQEWAGEHLHFFRLAFSPIYNRAAIRTGIRTAVAEHGVTDYTVYELFAGGYDIFLRAWLKTSQVAFERDLHAALGQFTVVSQAFWANRILVHWPWQGAPGVLDVRPISPSVLRRRLGDDEISRINTGSLSAEERSRYEEQNLIAPLHRAPGIKFFTEISSGYVGVTQYATQQLERGIIDVLHKAPTIAEKSLYGGVGSGNYLLMGRTEDFFAIDREITQPLNDAIDPGMFGARTTTYPVSRPDFVDSRYELRLAGDAAPPRSAAEALEAHESQTLEVKGSVFVNLRRWLHGDGVLEADPRMVDEGLLKTITGFLNADGGTLIIGALERERFDNDATLVDAPRCGSFIVIGTAQDTDGDDWDKYQRRMRVLFEKRVKPEPNPWIMVGQEEVAGVPVCVVTVRPADRWFYHYMDGDPRPRFWVRQGNRTVELAGPESDAYRGEKDRR
jgi:hypothetical protein